MCLRNAWGVEKQRAISASIKQMIKVGILVVVRISLHGHAMIVHRSITLRPCGSLTNQRPD